MTSIVIEGRLDQQHLREDGSPWPFAAYSNDHTIFAETAGGILENIIPGYGDFPDTAKGHDDALEARWRCAVATATDVQAMIVADRVQEGLFDLAVEPEEVVNALLKDKTVPVLDFETWEHPHVPLVLLATDYAPYHAIPPVTGNVLWIDPADEVGFLQSLANIGAIEFYTHDEA